VVPVLRDWGTMQPTVGGAKSPADFLRDYCVSSMVLSAYFRFKPVVGNTYFLYAGGNIWNLSLIAPYEWGERKSGEFLGTCRLRPDMTWEMDTTDMDQDSAAAVRAKSFIEGFVDTLSGQESIANHLPFYVSGLPYYQRMLATALASSLQRTLPHTGDDMQALLLNQQGTIPSLSLR
jgi:hypothetical protein